ncbi:MAG: sensor histidine kinase, partial [Planctomycetes bacterium]|nr:sensor histidine kinase [Planctomycetota bacterium]
MLQSIRTRFIALFAALVLAPIALLSALSVWESRRLAESSVAEYEKSLTERSQSEMLTSVRELARLQDRTFSGIERRAQAMAAQSALLFQSREACELSGKWRPERLKPGGYGFVNAPGDPASIWVPKAVILEQAQKDLSVLAHVESVLLAEPRGEGMTQWYVIHRSGVAILVPPASDIPMEPGFDPRDSVFYLPATPDRNPGGKIVWTDVYNDPAGNGLMISCLAPIGRGAGFEGIIGIDVNAREFQSEVSTAGGSWEYAFLLDGRGAVLLVTPDGYADFGIRAPSGNVQESPDWRVDKIDDLPLQAECARIGQSIEGLSRLRIRGHDRILAHRRLGSTGWILGAVASPEAFLRPAEAMRATQSSLHSRYLASVLASVAILLVSCVLFGWFLTRSVTRPILGLAGAARAIGAGQSEMLIAPGGPDEIGTLADTLRHMVRDRGETQRAMAEAQKLAALGGMASGICHELNNLLAPILGFAQVLGRGPLTADQRAQVDRVERAARAAREVVGSLLDSTHELAGVRQRTDLNASVREALLQLESARAAAGVEVVWDLAIDLPQVMANPSLMQRAFFNVANNAIQAMAG